MFAPTEVPVRVAGPGNVERLREVDRDRDPLREELVEDESVVDAQDPRRFAVPAIPELPPAFLDVHHGDGPDAPELFREREIDERLLGGGVAVPQHDVLGGNAVQNRFLEYADVTGLVEPREIEVELIAVRTDPPELPRLDELERVQRGECLQLDQLRGESALRAVARDREIRLRKQRMIAGARNVERGRHGFERATQVLRRRKLFPDFRRGPDHVVAQFRRQEDRGFAKPELDRTPGLRLETAPVFGVLLLG